MKRILVIDDEKEICRSLKGILSDEGYEVYTAHTPEKALYAFEEKPPHLVLLDVWFGKGSWDGVYFLDRLKQAYPLLPIIMISGHATLNLAVQAIKKGAYDFIEKPIDVDRLLLSVQHALDLFQLKCTHPLLRTYDKSWPLPMEAKLKKLALAPSRLLLVGERGTGKVRLAFSIHQHSGYSNGPFVVVGAHELNALSQEELWGIESKGRVEKMGLLEYVQGGTMVIQNVHCLTPGLQRQLTKVLESGSVVRLAGEKNITLNLRFIMTACPDFMDPDKSDTFYKAFYDRVTFCHFMVPALRDKRSLISVWIKALLEEMSKEWGEKPPTIDREALQALQSHNWPGNIHELYGVLLHAMLKNHGQALNLQDLPQEISRAFTLAATYELNSSASSLFSLPLKQARAVFEFNYLCAQLVAAEGNFTKAAEMIGMERSALHRKLKALEQETKQVVKKFA